MLLLIFLVPPYGVYGGCDGVSHNVQGMVIINCLIPPYSVNGRFMLSFIRYVVHVNFNSLFHHSV